MPETEILQHKIKNNYYRPGNRADVGATCWRGRA